MIPPFEIFEKNDDAILKLAKKHPNSKCLTNFKKCVNDIIDYIIIFDGKLQNTKKIIKIHTSLPLDHPLLLD